MLKGAKAKKAVKAAGKRSVKPVAKVAKWKERNKKAFAPPVVPEIIPPEKPYKPYNPGLFKPGQGGRLPGSENKIPRILKELIMMATEIEGADGEGTDGALGYLRVLARDDRKTFAGLLRSLIPLQVEGRMEMKQNVIYRSAEEVRAELEEEGISIEAIQQLVFEQEDGSED
jgi:hypothetical protein